MIEDVAEHPHVPPPPPQDVREMVPDLRELAAPGKPRTAKRVKIAAVRVAKKEKEVNCKPTEKFQTRMATGMFLGAARDRKSKVAKEEKDVDTDAKEKRQEQEKMQEQVSGLLAKGAVEIQEAWWLLRFMTGCESNMGQETIVQAVCEEFFACKVVCFLGGFYRFQRVFLQRLYLWIFTLSFLVCMVTCAYNCVIKTAPFYDIETGIATLYFHVFGLHCWLFWRGFVKVQAKRKYLKDIMYERETGKSHRDLGEERKAKLKGNLRKSGGLINMSSKLALVCQVILILLGYGVFPQPALQSYLEPSTNATILFDIQEITRRKRFSLIHAILMWLAIPQHVPTVLSSLGLLSLITALHCKDAEEILDDVGNEDVEIVDVGSDYDETDRKQEAVVVDKEIEIACQCLELCQERLHFTCESVQWIWLHQLLYACMLLVTVAVQISHNSHEYVDVDDWTGVNAYRIALDVWQVVIAVLLVGSALVLPSKTTSAFKQMPRKLVWNMRSRGITITKASKTCSYMQMILVGFVIFDTPITFELCAHFASFITLCTSIYASGSAYWE